MGKYTTMTVTDGRANLSMIIQRANYYDEPTFLTAYGKPVAVVLSYSKWFKMQKDCDLTTVEYVEALQAMIDRTQELLDHVHEVTEHKD